MTAIGRLSGVALECRDPAALATFYSRITGWSLVFAEPTWYSIAERPDSAFHLSFQLAPDHEPPTWPDPTSSMQCHVHIRVDDLDAAEQVVLALGATKFDHQPNPPHARVFADPAGHPFCLCG